MLKETELAFVAGLVDSSSFMTIKKIRGVAETPQMAISTSVGVKGMAMIKDNFGGYLNRGRLIMSSGPVFRMLFMIYPFLKDKRAHAEVLMEFKESMDRFYRYKLGKPPSTMLSDGERAVREELWVRIQKLNLNGTDPGIK